MSEYTEYTALVRYLVEAVWNRGDLSVLERFVADDVVVHSYAAIPAVKRLCARSGKRSGYHRTLEDICGEDDRVIVRYRAYRMPDQGPDTAAAWPEPVYSGTTIYRFADGRIAEIWVFHESGSDKRAGSRASPDTHPRTQRSRQVLSYPPTDQSAGVYPELLPEPANTPPASVAG